nr:hypothetical protein [Bacteroidales bacterium]
MKNIVIISALIFALQNANAQKCDTLRIDGAPNPYGCPVKALNIYKGIYKKVSEAIFEPLNKATINYCNNCPPLQDWSYYNYENKWSNNPFQFDQGEYYNWKTIPNGVPCTEEQEPALFLANVKSDHLIGVYGNLPSIYWEGANKLISIYQTKQDSLTELAKKYDEEVYKQIKSGVSYTDIKVPGLKQANAQKLLLADESAFHQMQSSFSLVFEYNRTSLDYPTSKSDILKEIPFKLNNNVTIPYTAFDNLVDVSNFQENEDMKQQNDYTKKPKLDSKLGKQYVTWVQLGQNIPNEKEDKIRLSADYSVYNFIVKIQGISFEKNHEVLNTIDWNK